MKLIGNEIGRLDDDAGGSRNLIDSLETTDKLA